MRASELAFIVAEAQELLVERGHIELGAEKIDVLAERAEGWPAALVLAGLWLRSVLGGDSATAQLDSMKGWLALHNADVMTVLFLVFGINPIAKGIPPPTG